MKKFREIIVQSIDLRSGTYLNIANESKEIQPLDIYLVPKEGGEHERYVVDNNGLISKQSGGGGKLLPLSDSDGVQDNVSPYVSVNIDKQNGIRFYQYDNYYGMNYQASNFYVTKNGVNLSYSQLNDGNFQRSGSFSVNPSGVLSFSVDKTNSQTYQTDQTTLMLDPENTTIKNIFYKSSIGLQKFLNFSFEGIKTDTLPNAEGDPTFTKQVVIKDDGTFGVKPAIAESGTQTLYPKVDILELTSDNTNYYLKVTVSNMESLSFADIPYFDVAIGKNGFNIPANNISASYQDQYGYSRYSYTENPFLIGGFDFVITIPISDNTHTFWYDKVCVITVTWKGNDNLDSRQEGGSVYKPRRLASDSKRVEMLRPPTPTLYPKVDIVEYSENETHYLMRVTVNNLDTSTYGNSNYAIFNVSTGGTSANIDAVDVEATFTGSTQYASSPAPGIGEYDRIWGMSFNVTFPKASNSPQWWGDENRAVTVVFKGRAIYDILQGDIYKPRRYGSDTKLIKDVKPTLKIKDTSLPYAEGDPTFTRQLVQKQDGTIGYVFLGNPPKYSSAAIDLPENTIHLASRIDFKQDAHVLAVKFRFTFKKGSLPINTPIAVMDSSAFNLNFRQFYWFDQGLTAVFCELLSGTPNSQSHRDVPTIKIAFDGYNFRIAQTVEVPIEGYYTGMLVLPYNLLRSS